MIRCPARWKSVSACFLFSMAFSPCLAQTPSSEQEKLPDSPSASRQAESGPTPQDQPKKESSIEILLRRSKFFPDLATSKAPLTPTGKFKLFISNSVAPISVGGSLVSAGISQARDSHHDYGQGGEGYAKRFGASMARSASSQFFGTFVFASILHQDPRYFPLENATFKQSVGHALRRVVITHTDSGREVPNFSRLMGFLAAEGLANTYLPEDERTAGRTFQRFGVDIGVRAGTNILREYWPTIFKRLRQAPDPAKQKKDEKQKTNP